MRNQNLDRGRHSHSLRKKKFTNRFELIFWEQKQNINCTYFFQIYCLKWIKKLETGTRIKKNLPSSIMSSMWWSYIRPMIMLLGLTQQTKITISFRVVTIYQLYQPVFRIRILIQGSSEFGIRIPGFKKRLIFPKH